MFTFKKSLFLLFITLASVHSRPLVAAGTGNPGNVALLKSPASGDARDADAWGKISPIVLEHEKRDTDQGNPPIVVNPEEGTGEGTETKGHVVKTMWILTTITEDIPDYLSTIVEDAPVGNPTTTPYEVSTTTMEGVIETPYETVEVPVTEPTSTCDFTTTTTMEEPVQETATLVESTDIPEYMTTTVEPVELPTYTSTPVDTTTTTATTMPVGIPGEITTLSFILLPQETTTTESTTTTTSTSTTSSTISTSTTTTTTTPTPTPSPTTPNASIETVPPKIEIPTEVISDDGNLDLNKFNEFLATQLAETTSTPTPQPKQVQCSGCGDTITRPLEESAGVRRVNGLSWVVTVAVGVVGAVSFVGLW